MPNQINYCILDGHTYKIEAPHGGSPDYKHKPTTLIDVERGGTGLPIVTESGIKSHEYTIGLLCTIDDLAALDASYAKRLTTGAPPQDELDFIDPEGTEWNPAASGNGTLNTGVFFLDKSEAIPKVAYGWVRGNTWKVTIKLIVNSAS